MAKNKVEIDVLVDDKGTTGKVGLGAKKAAKNIDDVGKSAKTADRNLKGASEQSANGTKNFSKMAQGIQSGLVPAYAVLASNVFAITAAFTALKSAADFRVIKDAQIAFSSATGIGMMTLTNRIKEATDGLVGFKEASSAAAIGTASGLSLSQIESFAKGARDVSLILGRDVTDSFNRLIRGVTKAEPELLDELGIILRLTTATEKYAATIGKSVGALSLLEKSQAVAVEVQSQLDTKYAGVAASVALQSNEVAKLGVAFEKILHPLQQFVSMAAEPTARFLADNIKALTAAFALLVIPIIKTLIPGLEEWGKTSALKSKEAANAFKNARLEVEKLKQAQMDLKVSQSSPGASAQVALQGVKSKSSGIQKIQAGDFGKMSKKEINGLLRAAEKGQGAVTQMSKKMRRQYIAALRAMKTETKTSFTEMSVQIRGFVDKSILQFKKMKAQYQATLTFMKKGTALLGRAANKIMKMAGFVGIFLLVKDIVVEIAKKLGFLDQSNEVKELGNAFDDLNDKLKTTQKEFSKFAEIQIKYREVNKDIIGSTEDQVIAIGNLVETQFSIFKGGFELFDKYNKTIARTVKETNKLKELEKELKDLQNPGTAMFGRIPKDTNVKTELDHAARLREATASTAQSKEVRNLQLEINRLTNIEETRRQEYNKGFIETKLLDQVNIVEKYDEAVKLLAENAGKMAAGLRLAGIASQQGGKRFLELLTLLGKEEGLDETQKEEFTVLAKAFTTLGREASGARQQVIELNNQFDKQMIGITAFQTKFTDQISQTQSLIEKYTTGSLKGVDEAKANTAALMKQLIVLKALQAIEIGFQNQTAKLNAAKVKAVIGLTASQTKEVERVAKLLDIDVKRGKLLAQIGEAQAEYDRSGKKIDADKLESYKNQLSLLNAQNEALERQASSYLMLRDSMMKALESGTQTTLANLIKGDEKSLKTAILTIAKTTLSSAADELAKQITTGLFRTKTPEDRIKNAMQEGGDYAAAQINRALKGEYRPKVSLDDEGRVTSVTPFDSLQSGMNSLNSTKKNTIQETFTTFKNDLSNLFSKDTPFLKGLANIFKGGLEGFGALFGDLLSGLFGGKGGGGFISTVLGAFGLGARSGGVFSGGRKMQGYASGGIARGSTSGYPAVLHGTEAVVPLGSGNSIPVEIKGGGNVQNNVVVNVSTDGTSRTESSSGMDADRMGQAVAAAVQAELQNQKRSGGILNPYGVA